MRLGAADLAAQARALADRQREAARRETEVEPSDPALAALAGLQEDLEEDARRLALEVDGPLSENERGRLNTDAVRQPVEPLKRGDFEQAPQPAGEFGV